MVRNLSLMLLATAIVGCQSQNKIEAVKEITLKPYPQTEKVDQKDTYFGVEVEDPYRWLEDDLSDKTKAWVTAQNEVTQDYLSQIPFRDAIKSRLETLWNYEKFSAPYQEGEYIYWYKNDGLQNQSVLYRKKGNNDNEEVFLDPNKFSTDGTTSLAGISFSKDGSLVAYQLSEGGSDWRKVVVLKADDKSVVGDTLIDVKFSGLAWRGYEGFYYSSYEKPKAGSALSALTDVHKLYFHRLNTPQKEDELVLGGESIKRRNIGAGLTEGQRFVIGSAANTTSGNELWVKDLSISDSKFVDVVNNMDKNHYVMDNDGSKLFIYTELNAPNGRIVTVDFAKPTPENWTDLIPETDNVLSPSIGGGKIFASYLKDATSLVKQFDRNGKLERDIELPGVGTASGFGAKKEDKDLYYSFTSYIHPSTIYKYDIASGKSEIYKESGAKFDPSQYESKQIFY